MKKIQKYNHCSPIIPVVSMIINSASEYNKIYAVHFVNFLLWSMDFIIFQMNLKPNLRNIDPIQMISRKIRYCLNSNEDVKNKIIRPRNKVPNIKFETFCFLK